MIMKIIKIVKANVSKQNAVHVPIDFILIDDTEITYPLMILKYSYLVSYLAYPLNFYHTIYSRIFTCVWTVSIIQGK